MSAPLIRSALPKGTTNMGAELITNPNDKLTVGIAQIAPV